MNNKWLSDLKDERQKKEYSIYYDYFRNVKYMRPGDAHAAAQSEFNHPHDKPTKFEEFKRLKKRDKNLGFAESAVKQFFKTNDYSR